MKRMLLSLTCVFPLLAPAQSPEEMADIEFYLNNSLHWPMFLACAGLMGSIFWIALKMAGIQHPPHPKAERLAAAHPEYKRMGGWLLIPVILLFVKAVSGVIFSFLYAYTLCNERIWRVMLTVAEAEDVQIAGTVLIGMAVLIFWPGIFLPVLLVQLLRRRTVVPDMVLVYTLTTLLLFLLVFTWLFFTQSEPKLYAFVNLIAQFIVLCMIKIPWLLYFVRSDRVKVFFNR